MAVRHDETRKAERNRPAFHDLLMPVCSLARRGERLFLVPAGYALLQIPARIMGKTPVKAVDPPHAYGD